MGFELLETVLGNVNILICGFNHESGVSKLEYLALHKELRRWHVQHPFFIVDGLETTKVIWLLKALSVVASKFDNRRTFICILHKEWNDHVIDFPLLFKLQHEVLVFQVVVW